MRHLGADRVYQLAKNRFYWAGMKQDIRNYSNNKYVCLAQRQPHIIQYAALGTITSTQQMKIVGIDFMEVEKCPGVYDYFLVITDHFKHYTKAFPTCNKSSKTATKRRFTDFNLHFGCPEKTLLDQGEKFKKYLFHHLQELLGVKPLDTTPYHPMTNILVERINSTIIHMLKLLSESCIGRWKDDCI